MLESKKLTLKPAGDKMTQYVDGSMLKFKFPPYGKITLTSLLYYIESISDLYNSGERINRVSLRSRCLLAIFFPSQRLVLVSKGSSILLGMFVTIAVVV